MKAAVCHEFGQPLVVEDLILDPPQSGEVRVKVSACAICHSDIHYADGAWGGQLPAVYGHEASGTVLEVGPNVSNVKVGDPVVITLIRSCGTCFYCSQGDPNMCETVFPLDENGRLYDQDRNPVLQAMRTGAFAEEVVVHESQIVPIPSEMPKESASLLACGVITGLGAVVNTAKVPYGSNVVVIGCGGVGLNSIQGAVISGAKKIIAVDLVDSKLEAAKEFGATHTINPLNEDETGLVIDITDGRGADFVFVTVGSDKAIHQGMDMVRNSGSLVLVGMPAVGVKMVFEAVDFAAAAKKMMGSKMGTTNLQVDIPKLVELYEQGRLKLDELVTKTYQLEEINEAIDAVKRGEALRNVIVFE